MYLKYFLNDFETVPVVPIITGITFVFTLHALYFYCKVFIFQDLLATHINIHVTLSLSRIISSGIALHLLIP